MLSFQVDVCMYPCLDSPLEDVRGVSRGHELGGWAGERVNRRRKVGLWFLEGRHIYGEGRLVRCTLSCSDPRTCTSLEPQVLESYSGSSERAMVARGGFVFQPSLGITGSARNYSLLCLDDEIKFAFALCGV